MLTLPSEFATVVELKAFEDMLDAVVCCWVAICALEGRAAAFGDHASAIWVPVPCDPKPTKPRRWAQKPYPGRPEIDSLRSGTNHLGLC